MESYKNQLLALLDSGNKQLAVNFIKSLKIAEKEIILELTKRKEWTIASDMVIANNVQDSEVIDEFLKEGSVYFKIVKALNIYDNPRALSLAKKYPLIYLKYFLLFEYKEGLTYYQSVKDLLFEKKKFEFSEKNAILELIEREEWTVASDLMIACKISDNEVLEKFIKESSAYFKIISALNIYDKKLALHLASNHAHIFLKYFLPYEIQKGLTYHKAIKRIDLSGMAIQAKFPEGIFHLDNLEEFIAPGNFFNELPEKIGSLKKLKVLDLNKVTRYKRPTVITQLPDTIGELENLEFLGLCQHKIGEVPEAIFKLKKLKYLNLYENDINEIPDEIVQLTQLEYLNIGSNILKEFPLSICKLTNLKELNLNRIGAKKIPAEVAQLSNLTYLNISNNWLKTFDTFFIKLENLEKLIIQNIKLKEAPAILTEFKKLTYLDISGNKMDGKLSVISKLTNLSFIDLSDCELTQFPDELRPLIHLKALILARNLFKSVPSFIQDFEKLIFLSLAGIKLAEAFPRVKSLRYVETYYDPQRKLVKNNPSCKQIYYEKISNGEPNMSFI